jgi:2-polyprenyl-3-methyl-5-hydroxy-6-metoxy-1,4-benzoquinol methylase
MIEYPPLPAGGKPIWNGHAFEINGRFERVLVYSSNTDGWNDELTELHEIEAGDGNHPIDIHSRKNALKKIHNNITNEKPSILEIGCSSGYLLKDLKEEFPYANIVGSDIITKPLFKLGDTLSGIPLLQMDLLQCPLPDSQFDVIIALNVLEHIEDDITALENMEKLLKPEGILIIEVPQGKNLYDYYDTHLKHFRRYEKYELLQKISSVNLKICHYLTLGFLVYVPFMIIKKLNRLLYGINGQKCDDLAMLVGKNIKQTSNIFLKTVFNIENKLNNISKYFKGIRLVVVCKKTTINEYITN